MPKFEHQTHLDSNNIGQEEKKEQLGSNALKIPKEQICPPKQTNSTNKEASPKQNSKIHPEKFNGPLEKAKTANKAFGSIADFLSFFENRNRKIKEFAKKFRRMENMKKEDESLKILNDEIVPALYRSFQNMPVEFKNYGGDSKEFDENDPEKIKKARNKYAKEFEKEFLSLGEFYEKILHAYTTPGFLYLRMNEYLRTENWIKLDSLLIYTYCLFKAYQWGPIGLNSFPELKSHVKNGKLRIFRRADFDEESIKFYLSLGENKEFSWNGVISTSLKEKATRNFSGKDLTKRPILIIIEVDFENLQPENFNALYLEKISKCPHEKEVALASGSIFKLLKISQGKNEVVMRLQLVTDAKILAKQGKFLHGMLQSMMRNGKELGISCLAEKDLSRAIKHCKGNMLIEELEFSLCEFNERTSEILLDVLSTMKNLTSFTLRTVAFDVDCGVLVRIIECLGRLRIKKLEILTTLREDDQVKSLTESMQYLRSLQKLKLTLEQNSKVGGDLINDLCDASAKNLLPECSFEFQIQDGLSIFTKQLGLWKEKDFQKYLSNCLQENKDVIFQDESKIFNNKVRFGHRPLDDVNLLKTPQGIKVSSSTINDFIILSILRQVKDYFKSLKTLHLHFTGCKGMKEKNPESAATTLEQITEFIQQIGDSNSLHLTFTGCLEITDKLFTFLHIVGYLESLSSLSLNFDLCHDIKNFEFAQGLRSLKGLAALNINFSGCRLKIKQSFTLLSAISELKSLQTLSLDFGACEQITDEDLRFFERIAELESLKGLYLNLSGCKQITDKSIEVVGHLKLLTSLELNLSGCSQITDQSFAFLLQTIVANHKEISTLSLNFNACDKVRDQGLELLLQKIASLESLTTLDLSFNGCKEITDDSLKCFEQIGHLKSLTTVKLSLAGCSQITDKTLKSIQQIGELGSLKTLSLNFAGCRRLEFRKREAELEPLGFIVYLKSLTSLSLNFDGCDQIMDNGLAFLRQIDKLEKLTFLNLNFNDCLNITNDSLEFLKDIEKLEKLASLHLNFDGCDWISDRGLKEFLPKIGDLTSLKILHLNFRRCFEVTDETLKRFNIFGYMEALTDLSLKFDSCNKITDEGFEFVRYLRNLNTLKLNFSACEKVTGQGLRDLCENIFEIRNLTTLSLDFSSCKEITREGVDGLELTSHLRSLVNLRLKFDYLKVEKFQEIMKKETHPFDIVERSPIHFGSNTEPFDISVLCQDNFASAIPENHKLNDAYICCLEDVGDLKKLQTLRLRFSNPSKVSDSHMKKLVAQLVKHPDTLKSLHLDLAECFKITDEGLEILFKEGIQELKLLVDLHINFDGCERITNKGIKPIDWRWKSLRSLDLSFNRCDKVTEESLGILCNQKLESLFLVIPNAILREEHEKKILSKLEAVLAYAVIAQNKISKGNLQDFNLKRSKESGKELKEKAANVICFRKPAFSFGKKTHFLDENTLRILGFDDRNSYKTGLRLTFDRCKEIEGTLFYQIFGRRINILNSLQVLTLSFKMCSDLTDEKLKSLASHILRHLKSLETLELNFEGCCNITDKGIKNICGELRDLSCLRSLKIVFDRCDITDKGLKSIFLEGTRCFESLRTLDLSFAECNMITDESLKASCVGIQQFLSLRSLSLNFTRCQLITDEGLKNIFCKRTLKSLTTLNLSFGSCELITDKGLKSLCAEGIQHFKELEALNLDFCWCPNRTDRGLRALSSEGIQYLKLLKALDLNFEGHEEMTDEDLYSEITNEGFETFYSQVRKQFSGLHVEQKTSRSYKFSPLPVNSLVRNKADIEIKCLDQLWFYHADAPSKVSYRLTDLLMLENIPDEAITLSFEDPSKITDDDLGQLVSDEEDLRILSKLKKCHFIFDDCTQITGKGPGFGNFCKVFLNLQSLEMLSICFNGCVRMTDKAIRKLCEGIQHLKSLTSLQFSCDGTNEITDEGFQYLCQHRISQLVSLKSLALEVNVRGGISDKGLQSFCYALKNLDSLNSLKLILPNGDQVTERGLKNLISEGMPRLLKLENIQLSLPQRLKVSPNIYQAFLQILRYFGFGSSSDLI